MNCQCACLKTSGLQATVSTGTPARTNYFGGVRSCNKANSDEHTIAILTVSSPGIRRGFDPHAFPAGSVPCVNVSGDDGGYHNSLEGWETNSSGARRTEAHSPCALAAAFSTHHQFIAVYKPRSPQDRPDPKLGGQ
ncbi:hypothetical protein PoB_007399800 [Plakobranchus ocellatus]|uniref:Uncharacterized protein n=1 Tax=Plakobranchus ocellatus TaxID=259542 RepID=A0AAV4DT70_9GAST|nr:hypothetical protein PoB_007399800 [Plakobranchus ocellatus]